MSGKRFGRFSEVYSDEAEAIIVRNLIEDAAEAEKRFDIDELERFAEERRNRAKGNDNRDNEG